MCGYAADYLTPEMSVGQGARPSILSVSRNLLTANAHQGLPSNIHKKPLAPAPGTICGANLRFHLPFRQNQDA